MTYDKYRNAFFMGLESWKKFELETAKEYFEISINHPDFRIDSFVKLIQIDIKLGKFAHARRHLNESIYLGAPELINLFALLENIENNFDTSLEYSSQGMKYPELQIKSLLLIARLYIQTGNYEIGRKMYQTLQLNSEMFVQSTFSLACLSMVEKDYERVLHHLKELSESRLSPKQVSHMMVMTKYAKYYLGKLNVSEKSSNELSYSIGRLFDKDDTLLLEHIAKHKDTSEEYNVCRFLKYLDLKELLKAVRLRMESINPNHFQMSDFYRFRLDEPIGYEEDKLTYDICVATIVGTKDIITMYPIELSECFDQEGYGTSEALRLKRLGGINND